MYIRKVCNGLTICLFVAGLWCYCFGAPWALYWIERDTLRHLEQDGYHEQHIATLEACYDRTEQNKYFSRVVFQDQPEEWIFAYDVSGGLQRIK